MPKDMPKNQIEAKLDMILQTLDSLNERNDRLEKTLTSMQRQMAKVDAKLSKRCVAIELRLFEKTENKEFINLKKIVELLEKRNSEEHDLLLAQKAQITQLKGELEGYKNTTAQESLSREPFSKKLNLLVHGLEEDRTNSWESRASTKTILKKFLKEG